MITQDKCLEKGECIPTKASIVSFAQLKGRGRILEIELGIDGLFTETNSETSR